MKDVGATQNKLRMDLMSGSAPDVAADAEKLQGLFRQAGGFFKAQKAQDAVDWAKANVESAGEIMCRHLSKVVYDWVRDYQGSRAEA